MQVWINLVLVLQIVAALVMIGLVLVQHGKGADMGASFGGGASGSLFGATGSANFLSRATAVCAAVFFTSTLTLAYLSNSVSAQGPSSGGSVLDGAAAPAGTPVTLPGAIPGAAPGAVPTTAASATSAVPAPVAASAAGGIPTR